MARIRSIKPEMWSSERLGRLSVLARLNFIGLISLADDSGKGRGGFRYLLGTLHPYADFVAEKDFESALLELEAASLVAFYSVDGCRYYALPGWRDHQYIEKPRESDLPDVPSDHKLFPRFIPRKGGERKGKRSPTKTPSIPPRNGMEGKGNGMDRAGAFAPPTLIEVRAYCQERKNSVSPEKWLAHYEANGWMVGRNRMKDWKAAVRTWEQSQFATGLVKSGPTITPISQAFGADE